MIFDSTLKLPYIGLSLDHMLLSWLSFWWQFYLWYLLYYDYVGFLLLKRSLIQLLYRRISLSFIISNFLKSGLVGLFLPLKDIILIAFSWSFSISLIVWFLCCPRTWTAYLNTESKIAKYTVPRSSVLT